MTDDSQKQQQVAFTGVRRGDGGTYLIIADGSDEFQIAAYYASRVAIARRAAVAVAHITDMQDFVHWGKVEAIMQHEYRQEAEKYIWQIAKNINETHGLYPSLYIREGKVIDKIIEIIEEEKSIRALILAGTPNTSNQGPLVSYFSNKGISRLRIPVVIVPGHLDTHAIDTIT